MKLFLIVFTKKQNSKNVKKCCPLKSVVGKRNATSSSFN